MYRITVDGETVHMSGTFDRDTIALAATLSLTVNSSGQLSITLPPNNYGVQNDLFKKLKSIVRVFKDNQLIWKGRVLDSSRDFIGRCTYKCEGMLSVLCDSVVRPQSTKSDTVSYSPYALIKELIDKHNSQMVDSAKQFTLVRDDISTSKRKFPVGAYENTFDYIQANFLNNKDIGGVMYLGGSDFKTLYYLSNDKAQGRKSDQSIVFGENLLDLTEYIDASEIYTVLIPLGKDDLTVKKANNNKDYIDADSKWINLFGRIYHQESFSDIDNSTTLLKTGKKVLQANLEADHVSIDISAFDLSLINVDAGEITIGAYTRVVSPVHDIDQGYMCSAINLDLCNPANSTYTFGKNPDSSFTGKQVISSKKMDQVIKYGVETSPITELTMNWNAGLDVGFNYTVSDNTFYYQNGECHLDFDLTFPSGARWTAGLVSEFFTFTDTKYRPKTDVTTYATQTVGDEVINYTVFVPSYDMWADGKGSVCIGKDYGESETTGAGATISCSMTWESVGGE